MRDILFRGKDAESSKWLYGWVFGGKAESIIELDTQYVSEEGVEAYYTSVVIPETVGQYTGLDDKNGVKIFEGDVVRYLNSIESGNGVVISDSCAFLFNWIDIDETDSLLRHFQCSEELEVIGNVHDNSELMEVGNDH